MFAATPCYQHGFAPYLCGPMPRHSVGLQQVFSYTMSPAGLCPLFMWAYAFRSVWATLGSEIYVGPCRSVVFGLPYVLSYTMLPAGTCPLFM